jgi:hypothetical protein
VSDGEALDPEIAELLGIPKEKEDEFALDFENEAGRPIAKTKLGAIDMTTLIKEKDYYSKIIGSAGEIGQKLHELITNFIKARDKDEKSMYRERIGPAFWNVLHHLIEDFFDSPSGEKQALFRYGLLNPSLIDETQRSILVKMNQDDLGSEDFYYVDEWLFGIGNGKLKPSSVDETKTAKKKSTSAIMNKLERKSGARDAEIANLKQKIENHTMIERSLSSSVSIITHHDQLSEYGGILAPYTGEQKNALSQLLDIVKSLQKSDREIESSFRALKSLDGEIKALEGQTGEVVISVDTKTVRDEFSTLRQMTKMAVGRQGNHFPFLLRPYMPSSDLDICTKRNLQAVIENVEHIDPGVFKRTYKQEEHRILPHFIIVPCFGDAGICWEPFDRMNRGTGKGRIALPLYPKDLQTAVLAALADQRWQMAKEKALHYWMEEGLTGYYYDYSQKNKLKGDLKDMFIQDYILWIKYESQGMQKLTKEAREILWRHTPFPQDIKDSLKNRGYYYADLYKRDKVREMSRGY